MPVEVVAGVVHPVAYLRLRRRPVEGPEWQLDGLADQDVEVDERLGGVETYGVAHRLVYDLPPEHHCPVFGRAICRTQARHCVPA
jgi:hypothetical protein